MQQVEHTDCRSGQLDRDDDSYSFHLLGSLHLLVTTGIDHNVWPDLCRLTLLLCAGGRCRVPRQIRQIGCDADMTVARPSAARMTRTRARQTGPNAGSV